MGAVLLLCLGASVCFGAAPPLPKVGTPATVTEAQVSGWMTSWQKRLHLEDWNIEVHMVRSADLRPDTLGNLKWNNATRTACIKVLNPVDYQILPADVPEDMEYTVLHELVHLQLSALPRDLSRKDVEEQVVNRIADALMQLHRGDSFHARSQPVKPHPKRAEAPAGDVAGRQAGRPY